MSSLGICSIPIFFNISSQENAFANCTLLSNMNIPSTATTIADNAFENDMFLFVSTDKLGDEASYVEN